MKLLQCFRHMLHVKSLQCSTICQTTLSSLTRKSLQCSTILQTTPSSSIKLWKYVEHVDISICWWKLSTSI